jgi:DNA-binding protein Fis
VPEAELPTYDALLEQVEAIMLGHLLERHDQRPTRLASALRIHRATLRQKLRRSGLQRDES